MDLRVTTYNIAHKEFESFNTSETFSCSPTHETPAKIFIEHEGKIVACNYKYYICAADYGVFDGNFYVPASEQPADVNLFTEVTKECFVNDVAEGKDFHEFIIRLMENPPEDVRFIRYEGVESIVLPRQYWRFFGVSIPKRKRVKFVHHFSLGYCYSPPTPLRPEHRRKL